MRRNLAKVRIAIVGSGLLSGSTLARETIYKSLQQFMPEQVLLFPGHTSFNEMVKAQAARLSLSVEHLQPPPPFWVGACSQSVRKGLARGVYARDIAKRVDLVLAFKAEGRSGASFAQLVKEAKEAVVLTIRPSSEELLSTIRSRRPAVPLRSPDRGSGSLS